ncbi:hypothetical protein [Modestobacter lacusdianchii]
MNLPAQDWVVNATEEAMTRILSHAKKVRPPNTEEFTFRAFFMTAAERLNAPDF